MYEYCTGKHWSLDWMEENQTATYFHIVTCQTTSCIGSHQMSHFKQPIRGNPTKSLGIEQFIILKAVRIELFFYKRLEF
jgi:hypothetical protein